MKFQNKIWIKAIIIIIILATIYLYIFFRQQKIYKNNPGLIPPRGNYNIQLNITKEEKAKYEEDLKKYDDLINNFKPITTGSKNTNSGNIKQKPDVDRFFQKARALEYLGRYNESIKTLNKVFDYYQNSSVARNNLGILYARVGEYDIAIKNFKKLIETFGDPYGDRSENIMKWYIQLKDGKNAMIYLKQYLRNGGFPDINVVNKIMKLNGLKEFENDSDFQKYINDLLK